jgi:hypothetical protein
MSEGIDRLKRRTEITIETERLLVLSRHGESFGSKGGENRPWVWCFSCAGPVRGMTTDEAALQAHVTSRNIFHQVESGLIHFIETSEGLLLICPNSL